MNCPFHATFLSLRVSGEPVVIGCVLLDARERRDRVTLWRSEDVGVPYITSLIRNTQLRLTILFAVFILSDLHGSNPVLAWFFFNFEF